MTFDNNNRPRARTIGDIVADNRRQRYAQKYGVVPGSQTLGEATLSITGDMAHNTASLGGSAVRGAGRLIFHLVMLCAVLVSLILFWPLGLVLLCIWAFCGRKRQNIVQQVIVVQQPPSQGDAP
jgi:hypothetical protein